MILSVENVHKTFEGTEVLKGVSLCVDKGDVVSLIGPSGAGKTTLLRCINFLESADSGTMEFAGRKYDMHNTHRKEKAEVRKRTGFVFQNFNLFRNKSALENVMEGLVVVRKKPRKEAEDIAFATLSKVGISKSLASHYPSELSGGQQQRVAIARAIASNPEIVYFDEPTSALDPELAAEVISIMKMLADEGMTMLVVTHSMELARSVSKQVVFLDHGVVIERGNADEFFSNPKEARVRDFLSLERV